MNGLPKCLLVITLLVTLLGGACGSSPALAPDISPPAETTSPPSAAVDSAIPPLPEDLDFDRFVDESYKQLLRRDPETVTELGLSQVLGTGNDRLTDISEGYLHQTQALESSTLERLKRYDRTGLTPQQQLTYDIYAWYLDDLVRGHPFAASDYPVNPTIFSVPKDLTQFFTDIHPITNLKDARDYVTRLEQVNTKFEQLIDGLNRRQQAGVVLPRFLIQWVLYDMSSITGSPAQSTPFYRALETKLNALPGVSDADRRAVLDAADAAIRVSVLPGFQALAKTLHEQEAAATDDAGIWKLPDSAAYYTYLLRHHTSTNFTASQIHDLGIQQLERIHQEMRVIFDQLGYPAGESLPRLYERVAGDGGFVSGAAIKPAYEALIRDADQRVRLAFNLYPKSGVVVLSDPIGGYYLPPALDGSRPGAFYAQVEGTLPTFNMPTLAYHEAIPGHHTQIALAGELKLPLFQSVITLNGYAEGWALYAERLVWELGFYEGNPYGNLGRLQYEAFRAARLVVDTGLHADRWSYDQAVEFMVENTGLQRQMMEYEVARYLVLPGQATAYETGMLKILELRQKARDALGVKFILGEFHDAVLGHGAMPLEVLERVVEAYIQGKW